jgi:outer membrane protein assembly factor BamB
MNDCCPFARWRAGLIVLAALGLAWAGLTWLDRDVDAADKDQPRKAAKADNGDWPMFGRSPARNMVNPNAKNTPTSWKAEGGLKNVKWVAKVGSHSYGNPIIAGGKVYVGTNNDYPRDPKVKGNRAVLMCFRESDGKFLWQITHAMPEAEVLREAVKDGLCSTPTVDGDRIYYVTPGCEVVCADTAGKIVWSFDMMKKLKVYPAFLNSCSPLVVDDLVFVVSGNGRDADNELRSPKAPSFVAFHKKTGQVAWQDASPGANILDGQWANAAYGVVKGKPQVIFPGGDGWLYAFEPKSGKLIWKFDCNPKNAKWGKKGTEKRNMIIATPVVYDDKVYVATGLYPDHPLDNSGPAYLWCVGMTGTGDVSAELVVDAKADPVKTKPNPNSALVWKFGGPVLPRPDTGREVVLGQSISTCAIHDGLVYLAEIAGMVYCLDAKNGKKYWEHDLKSGVWGSPMWANGKVYIGDEDGDVILLNADKELKASEPNEMGESVLSTPVAANGMLYVLTKSKLYAIGK